MRKVSDNLRSELNASHANLREEASGAHAVLRKEASDAHAALRLEASNAHAALRVELMAAIPVAIQSCIASNGSFNNMPSSSLAADPFVQTDHWKVGQNVGTGNGGPTGGMSSQGFPNYAGQSYEVNRDRSGKWVLYDEKVHINNKYTFDSKRPEVWLQDVRDYVAGLTRELDQLLLWIETQKDEIDHLIVEANYSGMCDCAPRRSVAPDVVLLRATRQGELRESFGVPECSEAQWIRGMEEVC